MADHAQEVGLPLLIGLKTGRHDREGHVIGQREGPLDRLQPDDFLDRIHRPVQQQQQVDIAPLAEVPSSVGAIEQQAAETVAVELLQSCSERFDDWGEVRGQVAHDEVILHPPAAPQHRAQTGPGSHGSGRLLVLTRWTQQIVASVPDLVRRKVAVDEDALPDDRPTRLPWG